MTRAEPRKILSLNWDEAVALRAAVSFFSESEGIDSELDALLDKLYVRLNKAVVQLDKQKG